MLKREVQHLSTTFTPSQTAKPKLGYVLVGHRPDSELYVKMKKKTCKQIGISTVGRNFPETATQDEVQSYVGELNEDPSVNGILVQLPLPDTMDSNAV